MATASHHHSFKYVFFAAMLSITFVLAACSNNDGAETAGINDVADPGNTSTPTNEGGDGSGTTDGVGPDNGNETSSPSSGTACADLGNGALYEVGPNFPYTSVGSVPWANLGPGDTVRIHWRQQPYREKILISNQGSAAQPIRVCGVPNENGERPVIDGENATTSPNLAYFFSNSQTRGLIMVARDPGDEFSEKPKHIVIENLEVRNASQEFSFTDENGETLQYPINAAGIYIRIGENITVRNCVIHGNGNGIFGQSSGDEASLSRNFLIEGNTFYDNSVVGEYSEHHSYIEAENVTYQFNRYGNTRTGSLGGALKDRSAGTVVRYNWFEGGLRMIDLVEAQGAADVLTPLPSYRSTYVYGNVLNMRKEDATLPVHYGGDSSPISNYRRGTLYFYNNTVVARIDRADEYQGYLLDIQTNEETAQVWNNLIFAASENAGSDPMFFNMVRDAGQVVYGPNNLVSTAVQETRGFDFNGSSRNYAQNVSVLPNNDPRLINLDSDDFRPTEDSAVIDAGVDEAPNGYAIQAQYVTHNLSVPRMTSGSTIDIGAFEFSESSREGAGTDGASGTDGTDGTEGTDSSTDNGNSNNRDPQDPGVAGPVPGPQYQPNLGGISTGLACNASTVHCVATSGAEFNSIQTAVDSAISGDTIQVAAGTYRENVYVSSVEISLLGGFADNGLFQQRNPADNASIIDGQNRDSVITLELSGNSFVDGFVLRNGTGNSVYGGNGGGVFVYEGAPTISNNIIENNILSNAETYRGGGVYLQDCDGLVENNIVRNNTAPEGAGIAAFGREISIVGNLVEDNIGLRSHGGGLYVGGEDIVVSRNLVQRNRVGEEQGYSWGGGLIAVGMSDQSGLVRLDHNRFTQNKAVLIGSGVFVDEGAYVQMFGDLIHDNQCSENGSGMYVDGRYDGVASNAEMVNVTIAGHDCPGLGHGLYVEGGSNAIVRNSIFWNNAQQDIFVCPQNGPCEGGGANFDRGSSAAFTYSLLEDARAGTGNIFIDPNFVDPSQGDFHLNFGSPAIDAADPADPVLSEPSGNRRNIGSYGGTSDAS